MTESRLVTLAPRRCRAHKKNGEQCRNAPIRGGNVCKFHGCAAPQVQRAAKLRMMGHLYGPMLTHLMFR